MVVVVVVVVEVVIVVEAIPQFQYNRNMLKNIKK